MNSLGRLPREPSEGGATPFTGRRARTLVISFFAQNLPMKGLILNAKKGFAGTCLGTRRTRCSLSGAHGISSRTPCVVHRALTEMHVPLRHCLRAQRCTKRARPIKFKSFPKVPSTRESEKDGTWQDRKAGSRRISKNRLGSSLTSEPSRNLRPPLPHCARTLVVRHVEGLPAATRLRSQRRGVDGEAG